MLVKLQPEAKTERKMMQKYNCPHMRCVVEEVYALTKNNKIRKMLEAFSPPAPNSWKKNAGEWLTTSDIKKGLAPWLRAYDDSVLLDVTSRDWNWKHPDDTCESEAMCKFDLNDYIKRGKRKICVVFNLDLHHQPGSHWVALFICVKNKSIYYFDSTGDPCPKLIKAFVERVQAQSKFKFYQNKVPHQRGNNECGVYVTYFLAYMIRYADFSHFQGERISDTYMNERRLDTFFSPQ